MKLLSLFSGIGAFEKALDNLDIEYDLVNYCEIDSYASKAYSLIHGVPESKNLGDITKVETSKLKDIDMVTYGFPCQDISIQGMQKGFEDGEERTRSGLFFEALRIIEDTKPKYAIAENVKNLVSKRFEKEFEIVLSSLEEAGYNNYWTILNSKDFGIPQNRERVFIISIRKDIDDGKFEFPQPELLFLNVRDLMEDSAPKNCYLKDEDVRKFVSKPTSVGNCSQLGYIDRPTFHDFSNRVYSIDGIARTLMGEGGNCNDKAGQYLLDSGQIRRLTPKECFRLMGFDDRDIDILIKNKISNTQLYKMAGNSIVVDVLEAIFEMLSEEA